MQDYGLVSIITPSYNCARFVSETIESIRNQTYQNWELLITDDCSTDETCRIIESYANKDNRIKLFKLPKNSGAGVARNNSIKEASGKFIAFCDSDDRWKPEKLQVQLEFMCNKNIDVCYSSYLTCDEDGNNTGIVICPSKIKYKDILFDDSMGCLTCIYDAEKTGKVYMPDIRKRQDWAMKILLLQKSQFALGIKDTLAYYRVRTGSLSQNKFNLVKYNVRVYKEVLRMNLVSAWFFFFFIFMPNYILKKIRIRIINY